MRPFDVIPALRLPAGRALRINSQREAGIHEHRIRKVRVKVGNIVTLDSRLRGNDRRT
jgi:hypothetical protein